MEIQKIFSSWEGDERLYSVLMDEEELCLLESLYSEDEPKLKTSDKADLWSLKHLNGKKDRDAFIEAYGPDGKGHKYAKRVARSAAIGAAAAGIPMGAVIGKKLGGKKGAAIGAGIGAGFGAASAGSAYLGTRAGIALNKKIRKHSPKFDKKNLREVDLAKVANGRMTEEEFAKKYYL